MRKPPAAERRRELSPLAPTRVAVGGAAFEVEAVEGAEHLGPPPFESADEEAEELRCYARHPPPTPPA